MLRLVFCSLNMEYIKNMSTNYCLIILVSLGFWICGTQEVQPSVSLTVEGGVSLVGPLCPESRTLLCKGVEITSLRWRYNGSLNIKSYFSDSTVYETIQPAQPAFSAVQLIGVTQNPNNPSLANFSSILTVTLSQLQASKISDISCGDPGVSTVLPVNVSIIEPGVPGNPAITMVTAAYQSGELRSIEVKWNKSDITCPSYGMSLDYEVNLIAYDSITVNHSKCGEVLCIATFNNLIERSEQFNISIKAENEIGTSDSVYYPIIIAPQIDEYFMFEVLPSDLNQLNGQCTAAKNFARDTVCTVQYTTDLYNGKLSNETTAPLGSKFLLLESPMSNTTYYFLFKVFVNNTLKITDTLIMDFPAQTDHRSNYELLDWIPLKTVVPVFVVMVAVVITLAVIVKNKQRCSESKKEQIKSKDSLSPPAIISPGSEDLTEIQNTHVTKIVVEDDEASTQTKAGEIVQQRTPNCQQTNEPEEAGQDGGQIVQPKTGGIIAAVKDIFTTRQSEPSKTIPPNELQTNEPEEAGQDGGQIVQPKTGGFIAAVKDIFTTRQSEPSKTIPPNELQTNEPEEAGQDGGQIVQPKTGGFIAAVKDIFTTRQSEPSKTIPPNELQTNEPEEAGQDGGEIVQPKTGGILATVKDIFTTRQSKLSNTTPPNELGSIPSLKTNEPEEAGQDGGESVQLKTGGIIAAVKDIFTTRQSEPSKTIPPNELQTNEPEEAGQDGGESVQLKTGGIIAAVKDIFTTRQSEPSKTIPPNELQTNEPEEAGQDGGEIRQPKTGGILATVKDIFTTRQSEPSKTIPLNELRSETNTVDQDVGENAKLKADGITTAIDSQFTANQLQSTSVDPPSDQSSTTLQQSNGTEMVDQDDEESVQHRATEIVAALKDLYSSISKQKQQTTSSEESLIDQTSLTDIEAVDQGNECEIILTLIDLFTSIAKSPSSSTDALIDQGSIALTQINRTEGENTRLKATQLEASLKGLYKLIVKYLQPNGTDAVDEREFSPGEDCTTQTNVNGSTTEQQIDLCHKSDFEAKPHMKNLLFLKDWLLKLTNNIATLLQPQQGTDSEAATQDHPRDGEKFGRFTAMVSGLLTIPIASVKQYVKNFSGRLGMDITSGEPNSHHSNESASMCVPSEVKGKGGPHNLRNLLTAPEDQEAHS